MSIRSLSEGGVYTLSFLLTSLVIGNAFHQKKQFYPSVVYLTKSNPSLAVLVLQALVFVVLLGKLTRKIFFGNLRAAEVEHLTERFWYVVTETCIAFTMFREDFNLLFVGMITMHIFFKCFHWLAEDRVDYMERSTMLGWLFHTRILSLMATLAMIDMYFIRYAYLTTIAKGTTSQVVFGFEYGILLTIVFTVLIKYLLHCIDLYDENPWENKAVYLLYLELVTSGLKFLLYVVFVFILTKVHTVPIFALRHIYVNMRSFRKALADVILSRRAIRNMNQLYPDATEEDLQSVDDCIICREPMHAQGGCKKLPCSHIFHASCLRSWFQRQQTCPTCRMEVLNTPATPAAPAAPAAPPAPQAQPMPHPWQGLHARVVPGQPPGAGQPANQNAPLPPRPPHILAGVFPNIPNLAAGGAEGQAPAATGAPTAGAIPPPPPLPFLPFMGMPPMPPPPMPQASLAPLTEEQLRQLESDEREGLEARILWLKDIQTLLDSAVEQMHQYTMVMSALNATRPPYVPSNQNTARSQPDGATANQSAAGATANKNTASTPTAGAPANQGAAGGQSPTTSSSFSNTNTGKPVTFPAQVSSSSSEAIESGARPKTIFPTPVKPVQTTSETEVPSTLSSSPGSPSSRSSPGSPTSEQEELRRRRLAKFGQPTSEGN